jgi:hypothetical protein
MCYSWDEDFEKSAQADVAQEDPRKTAPERSTFWTVRVGRHEHTTEEVTADRTFEKV